MHYAIKLKNGNYHNGCLYPSIDDDTIYGSEDLHGAKNYPFLEWAICDFYEDSAIKYFDKIISFKRVLESEKVNVDLSEIKKQIEIGIKLGIEYQSSKWLSSLIGKVNPELLEESRELSGWRKFFNSFSIIELLACFMNGHKIKDKICQRCGSKFGVPKMPNPPMPPKKHNF